MKARPMYLIFSILLLLGCTPKVPLFTSTNSTEQTRPLPSFNQVVVEGRLNISLHSGYSKPSVILRGDPRDLAKVTSLIQNNILLINLHSDYPKFGTVLVDVRAPALNSFVYRGSGFISGAHIQSKSLDLDIQNRGRTVLGGDINLRRLHVKGPGSVNITGVNSQNLQLFISDKAFVRLAGVVRLSTITLNGGGLELHWVKSDLLTVSARGESFIKLAGVAKKLDLELWGKTHFNGRYLRVDRSFVRTHDLSVAAISTVFRQHTLATDSSNIYYYKIPEMKADFMAYNGATLDMRDWNDPFMEEFSRYNK